MSRAFDGARRVRAWPYPIAARSAVRLVIERARADGRELAIDDERSRIELGDRFERVRIEGRVELDGSITQLLPQDESTAALALAIVWRCEGTRLRRALRVALDEPRFALELAYDDLDGDVLLVAQLVRATEGTSRRHARGQGAWLGGSAEWTLASRAEPPRDGRFLEVQYQRFSEDATLAALGPVLYRLEVDDDEPKLWLNSDHTRAAAVLSERGTRGVRARLRETIYDRIACGVWTQLFVHAVAARDDEVRAPWHDAVLDELLPEVFRGVPRAELRARLGAYLDYDGMPGLLGLLDLALQRRDAVADHVVKLVMEALPDGLPEVGRDEGAEPPADHAARSTYDGEADA